MAFKLSIETVAHESFVIGEFPSKEAAAAKVQEMITIYQELDAQVGDDLRWENWGDVPDELRGHDRVCFESDMPYLVDLETEDEFVWCEDHNTFESPFSDCF